jgi:hypothetical protein
MQIDGLRVRRAGAVALAAVVLFAGVNLEAVAAGSMGILRLQLGNQNQFVYETGTGAVVQRFYEEGKGSCLLTWYTGDPRLAELTPAGGAGAARPGMGSTSIGVYNGKTGVPCERVSADAFESLTLTLGVYTRTTLGANAFDRLELDIEVKKDARVKLTTYVAGSISRIYELRTGASIIPGEGLNPALDGTLPASNPANRIVNCLARSDSGPDSGSSDNCRWTIDDLGQAFKIEALAGEFSLEGGGDFGVDAFNNNSLVYLTSVVESTLTCGGTTPTIGIGESLFGASCQVSAPPATSSGSATCTTSIHYVLRDIDGDQSGCEFIKAPGGQLAAAAKIVFPPEARTALNSIPKTTVVFPDGFGGTVAYQPDLCTGTVGGTATNPTILEVLTAAPPAGFVDQVPGNGYRDWACILEQNVEYLGPLVSPQMQVSQTILFWGDPAFSRD